MVWKLVEVRGNWGGEDQAREACFNYGGADEVGDGAGHFQLNLLQFAGCGS